MSKWKNFGCDTCLTARFSFHAGSQLASSVSTEDLEELAGRLARDARVPRDACHVHGLRVHSCGHLQEAVEGSDLPHERLGLDLLAQVDLAVRAQEGCRARAGDGHGQHALREEVVELAVEPCLR